MYKVNDSEKNRNQEICNLLRSGNQKGMELLFDAYYKPLVVWADTFLRDVNMAEDVVQDFFFSIWNNKVYLNFFYFGLFALRVCA